MIEDSSHIAEKLSDVVILNINSYAMNVRTSPAIGRITVSDRFLIISKISDENWDGVIPTFVATSPVLWLMASNIPVKLSMMPLIKISFSQSDIFWSKVSKDHIPLPQVNRPFNSGTRVVPITITPPPAMSCFIPN